MNDHRFGQALTARSTIQMRDFAGKRPSSLAPPAAWAVPLRSASPPRTCALSSPTSSSRPSTPARRLPRPRLRCHRCRDRRHPTGVDPNLAARAADAYGKIHMLFNNAGVEGYARRRALGGDRQRLGVDLRSQLLGRRIRHPDVLAAARCSTARTHTSSTPPPPLASCAPTICTASPSTPWSRLSEVLRAQLAERNTRIGISVLCPVL